YFLAAFFNAEHGRLAIERLQRGTIIFGVSLLDIPPLRVFWPQRKRRVYVGNKVRQAEQLREHARALEHQLQMDAVSMIPIKQPAPSHEKGWRISGAVLNEIRLDSNSSQVNS